MSGFLSAPLLVLPGHIDVLEVQNKKHLMAGEDEKNEEAYIVE